MQRQSSFGEFIDDAADFSKMVIHSHLQILKKAICLHTKYEPGDNNLSRFLQKVEIEIVNVPERLDSEPLELNVEGLNVQTAFQFSPGVIIILLYWS